MTSTPPLQIVSTPATPSTPLHGAASDRRPTRTSSRIAARQALQTTPDARHSTSPPVAAVTTPKSSRQCRTRIAQGIHSPETTPRNKAPRRVQVISPSSDADISQSKPVSRSKAPMQSFASSSTMITDSMLPTPVKTPKKKTIANASKAARALFQDHTSEQQYQVDPSPRRNRKTKRYNGFSLESFTADDQGRGHIQIYTDSRDKVPAADRSTSNPFVENNMNGESSATRKVAGTSKRRKVSSEPKKIDSQVKEAIEKDEGMVYVFRGRKVYRRFDDDEDEEEEIAPDELDIFEHSSDETHAKPLKTLTRRSIKPKRLFQSEAQQKARENEADEEALTDIEDPAALNADDAMVAPNDVEPSPSAVSVKTGRSLRSGKKGSPFDTWPRLKSGETAAVKGRKRGAPDMAEDTVETPSVEPKRVKT